MDRLSLIVGLVVIAGLLLAIYAAYQVYGWWMARGEIFPAKSVQFGSDDPAPAGAVEFNLAVIDACGEKLTAQEKLDILTTEGITIGLALCHTRAILEQFCERGTA